MMRVLVWIHILSFILLIGFKTNMCLFPIVFFFVFCKCTLSISRCQVATFKVYSCAYFYYFLMCLLTSLQIQVLSIHQIGNPNSWNCLIWNRIFQSIPITLNWPIYELISISMVCFSKHLIKLVGFLSSNWCKFLQSNSIF